MTCNEVKYVMPLYFSSELDAMAMSDFELHLDQCVICRQEIEQQRAYDDLLRDAIASQAPDVRDLRERISNRIFTTRTRSFLVQRPAYLFAIAASLLLFSGTAIFYLAMRSTAIAVVYADAVDDHYEEVVQRAPLDGWREGLADINALGQAELGKSDIIKRLGPDGYQMVRARVCDLAGESYVHVEYKNDKGEISIFIKRRGGKLPGTAREILNGCPIHLESARGFEVAGFQSEQFTVLIVSNLPRSENFRLARESAARIA